MEEVCQQLNSKVPSRTMMKKLEGASSLGFIKPLPNLNSPPDFEDVTSSGQDPPNP
jgi:hypothetical protein